MTAATGTSPLVGRRGATAPEPLLHWPTGPEGDEVEPPVVRIIRRSAKVSPPTLSPRQQPRPLSASLGAKPLAYEDFARLDEDLCPPMNIEDVDEIESDGARAHRDLKIIVAIASAVGVAVPIALLVFL